MIKPLLAAALLVTACMPSQVTPPPPRAGELSPARPGSQTPPPSKQASGSTSDTCGAQSLRYLIGRPRTEIPVPVDPGKRRVTCTRCPMTMDFNPARMNILFDQESGVIQAVTCG